jgi:hypothetical protein
MVRSWLSLLVLAIAVGALAYWLVQEPDRRDEAESYAVSTLKPADVTHIKLAGKARDDAPAGEIVLDKRDGAWRFTAPFKARAESAPLERMLTVLEARSNARYPATDLARYGLDAPLATLTANDRTIAYGGINPATREQYVLADNHVLPVSVAHAAGLPRSVDALLAKTLFASDERQPVRFDLPGYTVALEDGTWAVAPIDNEAGADERNAWVDAWKNATALTVARHAGPFPPETVKIVLKDGREITLGIAQRSPDVVLVRQDEGVAYHFFADAGRKLIAPPAPAADVKAGK